MWPGLWNKELHSRKAMDQHVIFWTEINLKKEGCFDYMLPRWLSGKESSCQCRRHGFDLWVGKIPWRRKCNPLQYSCLENPMDTGAWQVIVRGVTKSWTQLSNWACIHASIVYICQPQSPISSHSPFPPWEPYCAWNYGRRHPMPFTPSIPSDTSRFWTLPMHRSLARWGFLCIFLCAGF